jgi:hypothetical protein
MFGLFALLGLRGGGGMIGKPELQAWLNTLDDDDCIGIDDGGLSLVVLDSNAYYEIGGMPEKEEEL